MYDIFQTCCQLHCTPAVGVTCILSPLTGFQYAGSAFAADAVSVAELADAAESVKAKLPELPNPFFGRSDNENKGPQVSGLFSPEGSDVCLDSNSLMQPSGSLVCMLAAAPHTLCSSQLHDVRGAANIHNARLTVHGPDIAVCKMICMSMQSVLNIFMLSGTRTPNHLHGIHGCHTCAGVGFAAPSWHACICRMPAPAFRTASRSLRAVRPMRLTNWLTS